MEIRMRTKVFCTEDYDDNNTGGKLGVVLERALDKDSRYLVAFPKGSVLHSNTH